MQAAVIALAVIAGLYALACAVALVLSFRQPKPFQPAVPDVVPPEWSEGPKRKVRRG